jgi:pimeloyl-ACP methyl ester carboxylesterase
VTLAVHEWGDAADVPLVFWHAPGSDPSGADLAQVAPVLTAAGFRVLAIDDPGFDRSLLPAAEGYRLEELVAALHELVDERELDRPALMGHSWGGAIVVRYSAAHPDDVRALVLLDSGHIDDGESVSAAWAVLAARELPTLLLLATESPHVEQNRQHIGRFEAAVPHAEVRWVEGAGHGLFAASGPPLHDEIATWLVVQAL